MSILNQLLKPKKEIIFIGVVLRLDMERNNRVEIKTKEGFVVWATCFLPVEIGNSVFLYKDVEWSVLQLQNKKHVQTTVLLSV